MRLFGLEISRSKRLPARFLGDVVRVELKAGDVCVLMTKKPLPPEEARRISFLWRTTVGEDVTLLILDDGLKMAVLSPPQAAEVQERLSDERSLEEALST